MNGVFVCLVSFRWRLAVVVCSLQVCSLHLSHPISFPESAILLVCDVSADQSDRGLWERDCSRTVIPQYCIAHPYCARFLASLARAHSARTLTTWRFLYETKPAREIKGHFLLNEHGDLSFFLHNFDEIIIFFELYEF